MSFSDHEIALHVAAGYASSDHPAATIIENRIGDCIIRATVYDDGECVKEVWLDGRLLFESKDLDITPRELLHWGYESIMEGIASGALIITSEGTNR